MKKSMFFSLLIVLLCSITAVFAQEEEPFENPTYTEEFIEQQERMLENLDTLFPRTLLKETYDYGSGLETNQYDGYSFSSQNKSGKRELTITAYKVSDTENYNRGWSLFNTTGSYENFYFHIDVQLVDQDDSNNGWIWFQYSNVEIVGDEKRCSAEIIFPDKVDSYITKPSGRVYTTYYDLTEFENDYEPHTLEMIRLNGYTSVYIDRHFIVGFEDGFTGRFHHLYGVGLHPGGEYATYAFDNFIIRRQ